MKIPDSNFADIIASPVGDCDLCLNTRLRNGIANPKDIDACPRCTRAAEAQWVLRANIKKKPKKRRKQLNKGLENGKASNKS